MAAFCLASCNKEQLKENTPGTIGGDGDYMLEILEADAEGQTKSSPSTVELNLANLVSASSKSITAQLKKKSGGSWVNVDSGVSYSWSASSVDNQKFSGSGTSGQTCNVSAKAAGSGSITVSANLSGSTVATQAVPVNVTDGRALSWTNATTSLATGEVKTAVLNSNFSGTVTVSSDNSSFLVGTSENSLNSTASVTFSNNKTQTIYYKYTGSSQTTVKIDAKSGGKNSSLSVSVKSLSDPTIYIAWEDMDTSHIDQGGGEMSFSYSVRAEMDEHELDPGRDDFTVEIIDWGYKYDKNNNRVPFDFAKYDSRVEWEITPRQGETMIDGLFSIQDFDYQRTGQTFNLLIRLTLDDGRSFYAEYIPKAPTPNPGGDTNPIDQKRIGLYYALDGRTYRSIEKCGTYSSKYGVGATSYDGECYYRDFNAAREYLENGACTPSIITDKTASFKYYDNNGVEKSISVSVSKPTCLIDNMQQERRFETAYPYSDGTYYIGSHTSYVTVTITLPNSGTQSYWGLVTERDYFGGICSYYY